jgi:hypothetical protein
MPTEEEMFARWKALAGDRSTRPWSRENMAGFFQMFRPHGEGLEVAFEGVVGTEEILLRLLDVYRATAAGWADDAGQDAYFIVRNPRPITEAAVLDLVRSHLRKLAAMAAAVGDREASRLLGMPLRLEAVEGQTPWPPAPDDPETLIAEMVGDFMASLRPRESQALLMQEGFYTIACDCNLKHHLLWPLYREAAGIDEPFLPYFELWRHGVGLRFAGEDAVKAYVPEGKRAWFGTG